MFRTQITLERKGINMVFYLTLQVFFFFFSSCNQIPQVSFEQASFFQKTFQISLRYLSSYHYDNCWPSFSTCVCLIFWS